MKPNPYRDQGLSGHGLELLGRVRSDLPTDGLERISMARELRACLRGHRAIGRAEVPELAELEATLAVLEGRAPESKPAPPPSPPPAPAAQPQPQPAPAPPSPELAMLRNRAATILALCEAAGCPQKADPMIFGGATLREARFVCHSERERTIGRRLGILRAPPASEDPKAWEWARDLLALEGGGSTASDPLEQAREEGEPTEGPRIRTILADGELLGQLELALGLALEGASVADAREALKAAAA